MHVWSVANREPSALLRHDSQEKNLERAWRTTAAVRKEERSRLDVRVGKRWEGRGEQLGGLWGVSELL